jgi:hypothetical protein
VKLLVFGAALVVGTFLTLTGVIDLVAVLTGASGRRMALRVVLFTVVPCLLGGSLLLVGLRGWRDARSN